MKLIKQSFEFINQTDFSLVGIKKHIERCARVSYKSEDKITDSSYEKFVNMLEARGHDRPLEFGTVHLKMILPDFQGFMNSLLTLGILNDIWIKSAYSGDVIYITTNYRYYLDIAKHIPNVKEYFTEEDNEYYPKRYTVHMILSRGVMDEFRTHVGLSHLAESTRYCNYSKDKFNNEVTFVIPNWTKIPEGSYPCHLDEEAVFIPEGWTFKERGVSGADKLLLMSYGIVEHDYNTLIKFYNWTPQQARETLPLGIKSELISCGFEDAWTNFMRRRSPKYGDPGAHPMAAEIADKLCEEFIERGFIDK